MNPAPGLSGKLLGNTDIFVMALNTNATAVLYSGYLGGKQSDNGYSIAVDAAGNAYVAGQTRSKEFMITNAFQPFRNGKGDAILSKILMP